MLQHTCDWFGVAVLEKHKSLGKGSGWLLQRDDSVPKYWDNDGADQVRTLHHLTTACIHSLSISFPNSLSSMPPAPLAGSS